MWHFEYCPLVLSWAHMDVKLIVVGGDVRPSEITVRLPLVLGRGREAGISLPQALVSRSHCELYESQGRLYVRDLGSLNGTYVGSERIEEVELASGDLLTVGTVTFRAVYGDFADIPSGTNDIAAFASNEDSSIFSEDVADEGSSTIEGEQTQFTRFDEPGDQADGV